MSGGFGTGRFGLVPFGAADTTSRGRVYATPIPDLGRATPVASQAGLATLAADRRGFAKLSPSAGFSTPQTD